MQAIKVLNMIKVYGKPIRVNKASQDKRTQDVGANLFIGNLDPEVDEKVCSAFHGHASVLVRWPALKWILTEATLCAVLAAFI